ncbi:type I phosphomannose isomerase catalytic subunit [Pseudothermotoga thermarum]|uniref:Mannose-6-phosphate isomerase n=1 Tax=Pseudothermotoga thermarum DSM 5069 TaxID=688269 RepID=F7YYU8_9THEM|nr:type I phosphomannose isomerase catalytic subunit [Pseudothermotoga thermarum]AEH51139.1 Mannose-6-phosphate isomerase [Pseudothermotoga thermarum DSM 5069]
MIFKSVFQFRPMPWGNFLLNHIFKLEEQNPIGEVWLLSDHPLMKTKLLDEDGKEYDPSILLDCFNLNLPRFPLLLKLISSSQWLSVQVHPDDEIAKKIENEPWGKTECWYFLQNSLVAFLNPNSDFEQCLEKNDWAENLVFLKPEKGDFIFIPAGLAHALGPDSMLIEIQQSSDLTYRIYDWGRKRETHLEKAKLSLKKFDLDKLFISSFCHFESEYFEIYKVIGRTYLASNAIVIALEEGKINENKANVYDTYVVVNEKPTKVEGTFLVIKLGKKWFS